MRQVTRRRKILLGMGCIALMVPLLVAALPLWLPWVLKPAVKRLGAQYVAYHREGYSAFSVSRLSVTNGPIIIHAENVRATVPSLWLWRLLVHKQNGTPLATVTKWDLQVLPVAQAWAATNQTPKATGPPSGVTPKFRKISKTVQAVVRWIPSASLSEGLITVDALILRLPSTSWGRNRSTSAVEFPNLPRYREGTVILEPITGPTNLIHVSSTSSPIGASVAVSPGADRLVIDGQVTYAGNPITVKALFGPTGDLPVTSSVEAPEVDLPLDLLGLRNYEQVRGSLAGDWKDGRFVLDLKADIRPIATQTNVPPLVVNLHARGDTNAALIDTASVSSPFLNAELSKELQVYFRSPYLREHANLNVRAELERQPWLPLHGSVRGQASFTPTWKELPVVNFAVEGSRVAYKAYGLDSARVRGVMTWPLVELLELSGIVRSNTMAFASGKLNLETKVLESGRVTATGRFPNRWLPPAYASDGISLRAEVSGPMENLSHRGHLQITNFAVPQLRPLQVAADWDGRQLLISNANLSVSAGSNALVAAAALDLSRSPFKGVFKTLSLRAADKVLLALQGPVRISVSQSATNQWSFHTDPLELNGAAGRIALNANTDWPANGHVEAKIANVRAGLLNSFLKSPPEDFAVRDLAASAHWSNSPAVLKVNATVAAPRNLGVSAVVNLSGDERGLALHKLRVLGQNPAKSGETAGDASVLVLEAEGFLPLCLEPAAGNLVRLQTNATLHLRASTFPSGILWDWLASVSGVVLREPKLDLNVDGTWAEPRGQVRFQAAGVQLQKGTNLPAIDDLRVAIEIDRGRLSVSGCNLLVQRQGVEAVAELPMTRDDWSGLAHGKLPDWRRGSAQVRIDSADIAAFQPLIPEILAPQGEFNLDLRILPGLRLDGELDLDRGLTRPVGTLGPIRDIECRVLFRNRTVRVQTLTARVGGTGFSIRAESDLSGTNWLRGEIPPFHLTLHGMQLPLLRAPDALIRSDLNLTVTKTNGAPPVVSGVAHLRDSYFLSDLRALVPGKVASPKRRPPYFSIEDEPLASCRLDVHVTGEGFLKVRSPLFNGQLSSNLRLQGTLKDPVVLGDLKIDSGVVRFPFASLQVEQGLVTLTSQDPYRPALNLSAASRQFGYDIHMNITGPADAPALQFSSNPPLTSEQILLMVTAGDLPRGEFTLSPQQKAQTFALFLGRDFLAKLGFGDETEQRLTIRSGQEVSEQGKPTYNVEYKITDRWSVVGEYDRFGDYNAGVKWRVYSK